MRRKMKKRKVDAEEDKQKKMKMLEELVERERSRGGGGRRMIISVKIERYIIGNEGNKEAKGMSEKRESEIHQTKQGNRNKTK